MGYLILRTHLVNIEEGAGCEIEMDCDANVAEFMSAAAAILVEAESKIPAEDRTRFRADFLHILNGRRKATNL